MLLTISTTHQPATDLGFLLHKNPGRVHSVAMSFGLVSVVFAEASDERCTAAVLVEVDPVGLVRGRRGNDFSLAQCVNDRRLEGFDVATVVEVIEHLDPPRLAAFERALFAYAGPATVILTTPNVEYNVRFEWTRAELAEWAEGVAARNGYTVEISSDFCRGLVSDDENDQRATNPAFEVLHFIAAKRLEAGRLTVVDATNVQPEARRPLVALAKKHHTLAVAVVLDVPEAVCAERNVARPDRSFGSHVLRNQRSQLRRSMKGLRREGFHKVFVLDGVEEIEAAHVERQPLWNDRRSDHGPFDVIGDVHGCFDELAALLTKLGYDLDEAGTGAHHPDGRRAFFVGDLVDRGPATPAVLRLVWGWSPTGTRCASPATTRRSSSAPYRAAT